MARSVSSFAELQRQFIGAELVRREADSRKEALAEWRAALDDVMTTPPPLKVVPADG